MKRILFIFILSFSTLHSVFAQDSKLPAPAANQESFWERVYFGGNVGLQFGNYTLVNLEPQIGYKVTDRFVPGIGITYIYFHLKDQLHDYSTNIYGGSAFAKYLVFENIFLHAEFKSLNLEVAEAAINYQGYRLVRRWIPAMFVGGGLRQPVGERASFQILLLYDIIQDRNSPFENPIISVGFGFGF